ncbi:MAG: hypothetical protein GQ570_06195 [Helicobacteraceae bacterium]|nr:hypothetical protein [Helicobacteraceae bacterium]
MRYILLSVLLFNISFAEDKRFFTEVNAVIETGIRYVSSFVPAVVEPHEKSKTMVDDAQGYLSTKVKVVGAYADDTLTDWFVSAPECNSTKEDYNATLCEAFKKKEEQEYQDKENDLVTDEIDSFFLDKRYLDSTNKSYIKIELSGRYSTMQAFEPKMNFTARIDLSQSQEMSQKKFQLFVDNLNDDNVNKVGDGVESGISKKETKQSVGIQYFSPTKFGIETKTQLGLHGTNIFTGLRLNRAFNTSLFKIDLIEDARYETDSGFEEKTELYVDHALNKRTLTRIYLNRFTVRDTAGTSYTAALRYFFNPDKFSGFSMAAELNGNTKFKKNYNDTTLNLNSQEHNSIYNYTVATSLRQNFYRKWLFYQLSPAIGWNENNNFQAEYIINILFDFYFGDI